MLPKTLQRLVKKQDGQPLCQSTCFFVLHQAGFTEPSLSPKKRWAFTPPFHPYFAKSKAVYFCCTFLRVASTGGYPALCPAVLGLSSCLHMRLSGLLSFYIIIFIYKKINQNFLILYSLSIHFTLFWFSYFIIQKKRRHIL